MAALVTRGCSEMRRLSAVMGGRPETLGTHARHYTGALRSVVRSAGRLTCIAWGGRTAAGLSGVGDLMLTAFGTLSRNRQVGSRLGRGEKLDDILASMGEVAEGVRYATRLLAMSSPPGAGPR